MKATNFDRKFASHLMVFALVAGAVLVASPSAKAATGKICTQYGSTTQGSYTLMNNRWGTGATQCINVTSNGFQIVQQEGRGNLSGAPVSYPAIYIGCHYGNCSPGTNLPMKISAIGSAQTSVSLAYPGSGTYDAAYDIWLNANTNVSGVQNTEIMIWLNHTGSIRPIGSNTGTVKLGGRSWAVWVGNNGANNVVSYQGSGITSFSADLKPFLLDAITRGSGFGTSAWYLTSIQMGFEPWIGGAGLAVNSFSASVGGGGSKSTATPITPVPTPTLASTSTPVPREAAIPTAGTTASGSACSPTTSTITTPFVKEGAGTFCWKASTLATYINSWNVKNLKVNGVNYTNKWAATSSLPAKINGFWYISYSSSVPYGHFEAK